ncbi:MAG: hypothetical protein PHS49_02310 [Candidatus Gracilibacteria bacterium]|nr:hypothetical protein [Candidatus Gracilibacteria bacterium]
MTFINEKVIELKQCKHCDTRFEITDKDSEFYEKVSPVFAGKKYNIPSPTLCPECRQQRRLSFRNERNLYKRKCDFSDKLIFSFYPQNVEFPVYDRDIWHSDKWDATTYGIDFDFGKSFFEQFLLLRNSVPHFSKSVLNGENCDYSNNFSNCKNCYLCFNGGEGEDCYYSINFKDVKNCVDCYQTNFSENCYGCIDCQNCNKVFFGQDSSNCFDSYFIKNCVGCQNCFGCKNLTNKSYCIENKQYSKEDYFLKLSEIIKNTSFENLKVKFSNFFLSLPEKSFHGLNNENCIGDYINNSKNVNKSNDIVSCENIKYCANIKENSKNLMDVDLFGWILNNCYESGVIGDSGNKLLFCFDCWENVDNLLYCMNCVENSKNCFASVGIRAKEYCILNKQYTKEEYEILVPKIIEHMKKTGEWGEFFPSSISPFGYNETVAQEYFPLTKEEAEKKGFNWSNYDAPFPKVEKVIKASMLPENIKDIPDDILNWAIESELESTEGFSPLYRIIGQELEFYRKHNLPIPKRHPDQRHIDRMKLRNPRKLYDRKCDKCGVDMKTTYSPEKPEIVYCQTCYNKEVY